ncbi:MAG: AMP-binding protein, partial [Gemmatimonadaceae bacterium]
DNAVREGFGNRTAIVARNLAGNWSETTYRDLQRHTDSIAHVLVRDLGLVTGNRVLLRGYNGPMLAAAWLAVLKAGGVAVTTMPMLRATELQTVMQKSACRFALCDARLDADLNTASAAYGGLARTLYWGTDAMDANATDTLNSNATDTLNANAMDANATDSLDELMATRSDPFEAVATSSDDVCLIAFTSGTTGVPKGCMHFHRDVLVMCNGFSDTTLRLSEDDRCIGTPPLAFTFGLGGLLVFPMHARASTVLLESATPDSLLEAIAETRATVTFTAPTFYRLMSLAIERDKARFNTTSLRQSVSAGEALALETRSSWRHATGVEMLDGIGATEMIHIFIGASGSDVRAGAIGKAIPGYDVAILNDNLERLPFGEVGRLAVRGPTGCRYLADARQTTYVQGGWNITGDACSMDADGYVYFKARTDDLIISSGYNIGAPEVESAVLSHDAVAECAVIGVPDAVRFQCVKAFVVLKPSFAASPELARAIQDHVKNTIAPYKYPRLVEFLPALPKTETGKLQRFRLKDSANNEAAK